MRVVLRTEALEDLQGIVEWISRDSPNVAEAVARRILDSIERLGDFPELGRSGRESGTREWIVPRLPYIAVYEINERSDLIVVLAIFHGAEDR